MTNEYGTEQPPHEEDPQPAEGPESGAWTGDHPAAEAPADDFADPPHGGEETVTVSQEAESDETEHAMPDRSRSLAWPLIAGVGGLLFLGAVVYWQFGRTDAPPVPPMVMMAQTSTQKNSSLHEIPGSSAGASSASDIDTLKVPPGSSYTDSAPTTPTTSMATVPEAVPSATNTGSPAGVAIPVPAPLPVPTPIPASASPPAATVAMAPPSSAASTAGSLEARIGALDTRVEALEKLLNQVTKQLNQVANMMAANQAAPSLEDRLNKVEQNMLELQHKQAAIKTAAASVAVAAAPPQESAPVPQEPAKPVAHKKAPAKPKAAHKAKPIVQAAPTPHWVLRAATPNEAWVSAGANSSDLRHVQVGDILPGVGRIRAIRQTESGWEVDGERGAVR